MLRMLFQALLACALSSSAYASSFEKTEAEIIRIIRKGVGSSEETAIADFLTFGSRVLVRAVVVAIGDRKYKITVVEPNAMQGLDVLNVRRVRALHPRIDRHQHRQLDRLHEQRFAREREVR